MGWRFHEWLAIATFYNAIRTHFLTSWVFFFIQDQQIWYVWLCALYYIFDYVLLGIVLIDLLIIELWGRMDLTRIGFQWLMRIWNSHGSLVFQNNNTIGSLFFAFASQQNRG